MPDMNAAPSAELPSSRSLLRSTLIAAAVAVVVLIAAVLPAEYGVDPTGIGRVLGLTQMGEIKVALAREAAAAEAAEVAGAQGGPVRAPDAPAVAPTSKSMAAVSPPVVTPDSSPNSHVTEVTLRPNEGKEIKLAMQKGARASYSWSTDRGVVNYDAHGDSTNAPKSYHSYKKGSGVPTDEGVLVAAFDGMHGWFWRNRSREIITVTLRTSGEYQELKRVK